MAYIEIVEPEEAQGDLKQIYEELVKSRGKIAGVHKIQSLNPKTIVLHMDLYMGIMYGQSPLKRVTREIIGTVVSQCNRCDYCVNHHAEAVNHYWKNDEKKLQLVKNFKSTDLKDEEMALSLYAEQLTLNPGSTQDGVVVNKLKEKGFSDREILDTTLVVSYFNFVNRLVLALGVQLEEEGAGGYSFS